MTAIRPNQPCRRPRPEDRRPPAAFTLTELLVVVALIVLLVALLLTALGQVQQKSRETRTLSSMQAFANACEVFKQEHGFYPGVVPEDDLNSVSPPKLSGMENAVLHLLGGYVREEDDPVEYADNSRYPAPSQQCGIDGWSEITVGLQRYKIKVNPSQFGSGPIINDKPFPPYITPSEDEFGPAQGQEPQGCPNGEVQLELPEIIDAWGQPVIYLRRLRPIGPLNPREDNAQFGMAPIQPYMVNRLGKFGEDQIYSGSNPRGSILSENEDPDEAARNLEKLLEHPSLPGQARGAFMLLSAGKDGVYMSAEDGPGSPGANNDVYDVGSRIENDALPSSIYSEYDDVLLFGGG